MSTISKYINRIVILLILICLSQTIIKAQTATDSLQLRSSGNFLKLYAAPTSTNYGIVFPANIPSANQFLRVSSVAGTKSTTSWVDSSTFNNTYWALLGNANTTVTAINPLPLNSQFIGTTDAHSLVFKTNSTLAGYIGTNPKDNLTYGINAGISTTISPLAYNTFIGNNSGYSNTSGNYNTFSGRLSGYFNITGTRNTFLGNASGLQNTSGYYNTFGGANSGNNNTTGNYNTFLGTNSGMQNITGNYNTFIGDSCGYSKQSVQYGTFLGYGADATVEGLTNVTAIGYNAQAGASNSLVLGGTGSYAVNVGIGTSTPANALEISATADPLKLDGLQSGTITDSLLSDAAGVVRHISPTTALKWAKMNWFYMPSYPISTASTGTFTLDLYNTVYSAQFGTPSFASSGAPASIPCIPNTSLYYYVTSYDKSVFSSISISAAGVMTYTVNSTATACSYINIVFVIK